MTDSICEATGAKKLLLHSCHNVSKDDFESGATYLSPHGTERFRIKGGFKLNGSTYLQ